ncbi:CoA-acylating methylmalonate-semialdehyde dehydrogenase [Salinisphaera sp. USBA-960]|nr:CoA-acylating methylmalonate-semialdehyde dehydrogenase [Salifodinibacter halophilus]NNC26320.1 CoA-acylating methylmalonate-semialdehyde dehydrogenase [Salifodinibacter halophilus]
MTATATQLKTFTHFIDGQKTPATGEQHQDIYNPATGQVTGQLRLASEQDINKTIAAAQKAAEEWSQTSLTKRTKILFSMREQLVARTDELAEAITAEQGKVLDDSKGEIGRALEAVEYACGIVDQLKGDYSAQIATGVDTFSVREPLGVIAGITPFNFPAMVPMWMAPLAIATGNAFILKPSERAPSASLILAELWQAAGLPDGVFNVLQGDKVAVDGLLTHPDVNAVSFIGSTPIAQYIHDTATAHGKRVQALGGAKNHAVVLPDADIDTAADLLNTAAFGAAGERCMAISVAVAAGDAADALADKLRERTNNVVVADGMNTNADMGPLITSAAKERVERIIGEAEADGATLVADGRDLSVKGNEEGFFVGPTVIDHAQTDMSAYQEEIFGPVLVIVRVANLDEAIQVINENPYGNGTSIFTSTGAFARKFQRSVNVGMVGVNIPIPVPAAWHSFGGWNDSRFGDLGVNGADGVSFGTRKKVITQRWPEPTHVSDASFNFPSHS